jgi:hypothetical protein
MGDTHLIAVEEEPGHVFFPAHHAPEEIRKNFGKKGYYPAVRIPWTDKIFWQEDLEKKPCTYCQKPTKKKTLFILAFKNGFNFDYMPLCEKCGKKEHNILFLEETLPL